MQNPGGNRGPVSDRFSEAFAYTADLHRHQTRKGKNVPYISHLISVAGIVLEHGGTEDEAIAALLHDAIEDQSRDGRTREEIRTRFGNNVLDIVEGCSDTEGEAGTPKPPWRPRKEIFIASIGAKPESTRLVSAADKLHNARDLLADYRALGEEAWKPFNAGQEDIVWYYRTLNDLFRAVPVKPSHARLLDELSRVVSELERAVEGGR
jgi:(p)ppGpp synthase/HD superfamily hydrolase